MVKAIIYSMVHMRTKARQDEGYEIV